MKNKFLSLILALSMIATFAIPVFAKSAVEIQSVNMLIDDSLLSKPNTKPLECSRSSFNIRFNLAEGCELTNENFLGIFEDKNGKIVESKDENFIVNKKYILIFELTGYFANEVSFSADLPAGGNMGKLLKANVLKAEDITQPNIAPEKSYKLYIEYVGRKNELVETENAKCIFEEDDRNPVSRGFFPSRSKLTFYPKSKDGFDHWEVVKGNIKLTEQQKTSKRLTLVMPDDGITIKAVNNPDFELIKNETKASLEPLTAIPRDFEAIDNLNSLDKVKSLLEKALREKYHDSIGEKIDFYDVKPMFYNIFTDSWSLISSMEGLSDFMDEEGKIKILIPYPEGTNQFDYDFFVAHLITSNEALYGTVETPKVVKTKYGLFLETYGASPFAVSYKKIEKPVEAAATTKPAVKEQVADTDASFPSLLLALPVISIAGIITVAIKRKEES